MNRARLPDERMRALGRPVLAALAAIALVLLLLPTATAASPSTSSAGHYTAPKAPTPSTFPITHIVFLMQENHAYDNFFGAYCPTRTTLCQLTGNGIPAGTCIPTSLTNPNASCIAPFPLNESFVNHSSGGTHNWQSSHLAYNSGKMNGFYVASPNNRYVMGYYNGSTIPEYWNLAEQYALGDYFFSSVLDFSPPNHWYALAGQAPNESLINYAPSQSGGFGGPLTGPQEIYLNESNATTTLNDALQRANLSWNYYDDSLNNQSYQQALNLTQAGSPTQVSVFNYWNPLVAKAESYTSPIDSHLLDRSRFFTDAASGNLPSVSWVIPAINQSDHPIASIAAGMSFVGSVVNAVQTSPEWNSTAIFVTWDEYGGYYDHVLPPQIDGNGLGFRVPLLVVSPYTPEGLISNQLGDFDSVLHLMEWKFGLGNFTARDGAALLPFSYFDLNATPRAPDPIYTATAYPMVRAAQSVLRPGGLQIVPAGTSLNVSWSERLGGAPVAGYLLRWGIPSSKMQVTVFSRNTTSATIAGLTCNTTYLVQVRAFAGKNISLPLGLKLSTGACGPLGGPIGGTAQAVPTTVTSQSCDLRPSPTTPRPRSCRGTRGRGPILPRGRPTAGTVDELAPRTGPSRA